MKNKKLRILFRTSGGMARGKKLGLGHVFRCLNIVEFLKQNKIFFLVEDFGGALDVVKNKNIKNAYYLKKNISLNQDIITTKKFLLKNKIDILVVDKYPIKSSYFNALRNYVKIVLITDLFKIDYPVDLLVNGFIGFSNKIKKNKYNSKCLLGPHYQALNKNFINCKKNIKKQNKILATFGGYDESNIAEIFLKELLKKGKKIKVKIIVGPSSRDLKKKIKLNDRREITICKTTNNMCKEISNSEYGICSGGLTTYEFASQRVPFGIVSHHRLQNITAKKWTNLGFAVNLGIVGKKTKREIKKYLELIESDALKLSYKKKLLIDGLGAKRVAIEITKLTK